MKPVWHYSDVFHMNYYFCIGWKWAEYAKFVKMKLGHEQMNTDGIGHTFYCADKGIAVWIADKSDHITLAHECLHAANYTLHRIGNQASHTNDETLAYLQGHLMRAATKKLKGKT